MSWPNVVFSSHFEVCRARETVLTIFLSTSVDLDLNMSLRRQTPRSLAVQSVLRMLGVAALVSAAGCSYSDEASGDADTSIGGTQASTSGTTASTAGEDPTSSDTGEGDTGDPDAGTEPVPLEDPDLALGLCDELDQQVMSYALGQANAEAEPVLVRERVLAGDGSVPAIPLSARPFLNRYEFDYPPAEGWDPQISGELWKPPMVNADAPARYHLQYALRGPAMAADDRLPVDLAIVVDLGSSMVEQPLVLAEEALAAIEAALRPGDRVTLIAAGLEPIVLSSATIANFGMTPLTGLIEQQELVTLADVSAAVELAYTSISEPWDGQGQPRVLLISNGFFEPGALVETISAHADQGRVLLSLGLGEAEQFDAILLGTLAAEGRGPMLFASNPDEVWRDLNDRFAEHTIAAATDLQVSLSLPAGLGVRQREPVIEGVVEPKLAVLGPNHALVFHHELEACAELEPDAVIRVEAHWTDPLSNEAKQLSWEQPVVELGEGSIYGHKGAATIAYARALRAFRDGNAAGSYGAVLDAISQISNALVELPDDADLLEMSAVLAELSAG
jgi:hypothetical protein